MLIAKLSDNLPPTSSFVTGVFLLILPKVVRLVLAIIQISKIV